MTGAVLEPQMVQGEARIRDLDLAARLGFANPIDIRKLVRRYETDLAKMGDIATVAKTSPQGGRPAAEFYLSRKQAIFLTAKSETPTATDITIEVIERFDAYERGAAPIAIPQTFADALRLAADQAEQIAEQKAQLDLAQPKADALELMEASEGSFSITVAAKNLKVPPRQLPKLMERWNWGSQKADGFVAYQHVIRTGYLEHEPITIRHRDGTPFLVNQVKVTAKGLAKAAFLLGDGAPA